MENLSVSDFYGSILRSCGCTINPTTGFVHINDGTDSYPPLTINGRQLVLPTPEILRAGISADKLGFAPAGESIVRKESPVLKRLRALVTARVTYVTDKLLEQLMTIAADHSKHPLLTPEQSEFLSVVPEVDAKTCVALGSVLDRIDNNTENCLMRIYIKPNGRIGDTVYKRLAAVSFPITDAAKQEGHKIFGVQMRKGDKKAILALFDFILPNAAVVGHWNAGSHDMAAPAFQALMLAYAGIIKQLNSVVELFDNVLDQSEIPLMSEIDWVEGIESIAKWRAAIPTLPGNDGELIRDTNTGETPAVETETKATTVQPAAVAATQQATTNKAPSVGGLAPLAKPITENKGFTAKPAATQGFTVEETVVPAHQTHQAPAGQNWMDIQRNRMAPPPPPPPPANYYNSGYAVGGYGAAVPPPPPPPPQAPYGLTPLPPTDLSRVPHHLRGIVVYVDQYERPFDQNGQPIPPDIMHQLGYVNVAAQQSTGYAPPPPGYGAPQTHGGYYGQPQQPMTGRQAGMAVANARRQQENQYYDTRGGYIPPRY